jgi:hypothetical protein
MASKKGYAEVVSKLLAVPGININATDKASPTVPLAIVLTQPWLVHKNSTSSGAPVHNNRTASRAPVRNDRTAYDAGYITTLDGITLAIMRRFSWDHSGNHESYLIGSHWQS